MQGDYVEQPVSEI